MLVADENSFAGPSHAMLVVVFFQAPEPCKDRGVFFWLVFLGAEGVVAEGIEANDFGLVGVEGFWKCGTDGREFSVGSFWTWDRGILTDMMSAMRCL